MILKPQLVALPRITELLDELLQSKPRYLTVCDLKSGYYQISVHKSSRHFTAFTSPMTGNRYMYKRCPFGLQSSPAAMLQILTKLLAGKGPEYGLYAYMDDIVLGSPSWPLNLLSAAFPLTGSNPLVRHYFSQQR